MTPYVPKGPTMSDRFEKDGEFALERAIRRSHCGNTPEKGHDCVGCMTVTADRVIFTCKPCGTERVKLLAESPGEERQADAIVALGRKALLGGQE